MRYTLCSTYLQTQESLHLQTASRLQAAPLQAPTGFWRKFGWYLGGKSRAQAERARLVQTNLQDAARFRQGEAGEQGLLRALASQLDDRWVMLQDYLPPPPWRAGGDIDGVLVGPAGVVVFEAKAWKGFFLCRGDQWLYQRSQRAPWEPARHNPTTQALENVERMQQMLRQLGFGQTGVRPIVAVASDHMSLTIDSKVPPAVPLYTFSPVAEPIQRYLGKSALSAAQSERLWKALLEAAYAQGRPQRR